MPASHKSLEDRIDNLEKDLNAYAKFASNNKILGNDNTDGNNTDTEGVDSRSLQSLSPTWQNMKTKKRLESAEEAIDKLFSLINEILSKKDTESNKNETEKDENKESSNELSDDSTIDNKLQSMTDKMNNIEEELKNMKSDIEKNKQSSSINSQQISKNGKQISDNSNQLSGHDQSISDNKSYINDNMKAIKDQAKINGMEKLMNDLNTRTSGDQAVSLSQETMEISSVDPSKSAENSTDLSNIQQQIDGIVNQLAQKQDKSDLLDELTQDLSKHKENTGEEFSKVKEEIEKLNEAISNLDNEEVKEMINSMDDLKKMAAQINDLRKLNDLKDLADNVDSLKELRAELDALKQAAEERNLKDADSSKSMKLMEELQQSLKDEIGKLQQMIDSLHQQLQQLQKQQDSQNIALQEKAAEDSTKINKDNDAEVCILCYDQNILNFSSRFFFTRYHY